MGVTDRLWNLAAVKTYWVRGKTSEIYQLELVAYCVKKVSINNSGRPKCQWCDDHSRHMAGSVVD
jgi:hypothetical protein